MAPTALAGSSLLAGPLQQAVASQPPGVTLNSPALVSDELSPSFSGSAGYATPVTVHIYEGGSAQGVQITTLEASVSAGTWETAHLTAALADGTYTAVATQRSPIDATEVRSEPATFAIDRLSPAVTVRAPRSPSNETMPTFSGTASEATEVTVEIFAGRRAEGEIVATAGATGDGGAWSSEPAEPALPRGTNTFTAIAIQPSQSTDAIGKSAPVTFEVDTQPPVVTLRPPPSPSNDTAPTFSGTASDATEVTVEVFAGTSGEGPIVTSATATGTGGEWTSGEVSKPLGDGTFTALAVQASAIGNPSGESSPVTFTVDTAAPSLTVKAPPSPSSNRAPAFAGAASDRTPVTVDIYSGPLAEGVIVATASAEVDDAGGWESVRASPRLAWGHYTAVATQASSLGNPAGVSAPVTFDVEPIAPDVATETASAVTRTSAAMYAWVDPLGGDVSDCHFEFGTTAAYGSAVECGFVAELSAFPASATAAIPVFARIYGLHPSTTYHYRIVATDEGGTGRGADESFTTAPPLVFGEQAAQVADSPAGPSGGVSASQVASLLARQLTLTGRKARIASLLKSGAIELPFRPPSPGTATVRWYRLASLRTGHGETVLSRTLVALGTRVFATTKPAALRLRLTAAGRRLLRSASSVVIGATCVFTPRSGAAIRSSAAFRLRR
ncbi:MAG TPA: Ig-like domain-containing protein [Solirubrobacteraceae bacterium]|jgi:hypothetical protein